MPSNENTSLRGMKVLAVDSDRLNLCNMKHVLEKAGATVTTADKGKTAVSFCCNGKFDLILIDLELPDVSGTDVIRWLAANDMLERQPVFAMSSGANGQIEEDALQSGAKILLGKPLRVGDINDALREVCRIRVSVSPVHKKSGLNSADGGGRSSDVLIDEDKLGHIIGLFTASDLVLFFKDLEKDFEDHLLEMENFMAAGNCASTLEILHKEKGKCQLLGFQGLVEKIERFEEIARKDNMGVMKAEVFEVRMLLADSLLEFRSFVLKKTRIDL